VKAIETRWKGWRFRSRTEARWAVFLEALGIGFEYEAEGYHLPSGPYLPDFVITSVPDAPANSVSQRLFLEVKPDVMTPAEQTKVAELARASGDPVLVAIGAPDHLRQMMLYEAGADEKFDALLPYRVHLLGFLEAHDGALVLGRGALEAHQFDEPEDTDSPNLRRFYEETAHYRQPFCRVLGVEGGQRFGAQARGVLSARLRRAYDAARGARFEFGETDKRWNA
jgi:hypothetical protein